MKKLNCTIFIALAIFSSFVVAKKPNQTVSKKIEDAVVAPPAVVKGPTGIGALKIGMSKAAVEALKAEDQVYPLSALEPKENSDKYLYIYTEYYKSKFHLPFSEKPLEVTLGFEEDKLLDINVALEDSYEDFLTVNGQISSKYGPSKKTEMPGVEKCRYGNGTSFDANNKGTYHRWSDASFIQTILFKLEMESCPARLSQGMRSAVRYSLNIYLLNAKKEKVKPVKNLPNSF